MAVNDDFARLVEQCCRRRPNRCAQRFDRYGNQRVLARRTFPDGRNTGCVENFERHDISGMDFGGVGA